MTNVHLSDERIVFLREMYEDGLGIAEAVTRPGTVVLWPRGGLHKSVGSSHAPQMAASARRALGRGDNWVAQALLDGAPSERSIPNLRAVCALRMGRPTEALALIEPVVLRGGTRIPSDEIPDEWIVTLATARVLSGDVKGGTIALEWVKNVRYPARDQLLDAVRKWKQAKGFFKRRSGPVLLDYPPGVV